MREKGRVVSWNIDKAYGFIEPSSGGKQLFIHVNDIKYSKPPTAKGQLITYVVSIDKQGRPCAVKGILAGSEDKTPRNLIMLAVLFIAALTVAVLLAWVPQFILMIYTGMSLLTFLVYWKDKSAARKDRWRTPESTLHLMALLGGWPGSLVAQQALRHKSRKGSFKLMLWLTITVNLSLLFWLLLTADGRHLLDQFIRLITS